MKIERINLHDLPAVRREMARVYREARAAKTVPPQDLMRMLAIINRAIFDSDIEMRLKALEQQQ